MSWRATVAAATARPAVRRAAIALAILAATAYTLATFHRLAAAQQPKQFFDSGMYFQTADRPLSLELLTLAKPPTIGLAYRVVGRDLSTIARAQEVACLLAWLALAASVVLALTRPWARVIAGVVIAGLVLAPARVGWTAIALSESLTDSLFALLIALGLALVRSAPTTSVATPRARLVRGVLAGATVVVGLAWIFARDTDAIVAILAVPCALVVWWRPLRARSWRGRALALVLAAISLGGGAFDLATASMAPAEPLPFQHDWVPAMTSRTAFPAVNNLLIRVMPDADARDYFAARGLPIAAVAPFVTPARNDDFVHVDPTLVDAQAWVAAHGTGTFVTWLARHPFARLGELAGDRAILFTPDVHHYMPAGWLAADRDHVVIEALRHVLARWPAMLVLLLVAPFALARARRDPRAGLALCIVATGLVATVASYYGDALETARHCFGAAQQILLGLVLAALAWLDAVLARRSTARTIVPTPPAKPGAS